MRVTKEEEKSRGRGPQKKRRPKQEKQHYVLLLHKTASERDFVSLLQVLVQEKVK